jgi:hypothetical protein
MAEAQRHGFSVLHWLDRGPTSWQIKVVCNADKVVLDVLHDAGATSVQCEDPMGTKVKARLASAFPNHQTPPPAKVRRRKAQDGSR